MAWEERMHRVKKIGKGKLKQKLPTPASWDNDIKTDVAIAFVSCHISVKNRRGWNKVTCLMFWWVSTMVQRYGAEVCELIDIFYLIC